MTTTTVRPAPPIWLRLVQVLWIILALASVGKFVFSEIVFAQGASQVCAGSLALCHDSLLPTAQDVARLNADGLSLGQWVSFNIGYRSLITLIFCLVGLAIFVLKRGSPAALAISTFLICFGTLGGFAGFLAARYPEYQYWFSVIQYPALMSLPLFFFTFPNGRMVPRAMWAVFLLWNVLYLADFLIPDIDKNSPVYSAFSTIMWFSMWGGGVAAQIYRFWHVSNAEERQQTKWVVYGIAVFIPLILALLTLPPFSQYGDTATLYSLPQMLFLGTENMFLCVIPVSIGIAVLRSRLWDIDLVIRRTLVYSVLTVILGLVYFGGVTLLQSLFAGLSGQSSSAALVISTLLIAALFNPLRRRIQDFIDRRFYRQKYNAEQALMQFAGAARSETELDVLSNKVTQVANESLHPEFSQVWLTRKGK